MNMKRNTVLLLLIIALAFLLGHLQISNISTVLDSDYAMFNIVSREIAQGHFRIFPFDQPYGGLVTTYLRAAWALLFSSPEEPEFLRFCLWFSYAVLPGLFAIWIWYFLRSFSAALFGLIGLNYIWQHWSNDLYPPLLFFGVFVLSEHFKSYLVSPSRANNFLVGLISGLALYSNRLNSIWLLVALLFHFNLNWTPIKKSRVFWISLLSGMALWIHGRNFSIPTPQPLTFKLDADPHFKFALIFGVSLVLWKSKNRLTKESLRPALYFLFGALTGFFPELLYHLFNLDQDTRILQPLPSQLGLRPLSEVWASLSIYQSWIFHFFGFSGLFSLILIALSKKGVLLTPAKVSGFVFVVLSVFVSTLSGSPPAIRYLYPIFAILVFEVSRVSLNRWNVALLSCLLVGMTYERLWFLNHSEDTFLPRVNILKNLESSLVQVDSYWHSYAYSLYFETILGEKRVFLNLPSVNMRGRKPSSALEALTHANQIGIWFEKKPIFPLSLEMREWCEIPERPMTFTAGVGWVADLYPCIGK
jgi:hypothetical protein